MEITAQLHKPAASASRKNPWCQPHWCFSGPQKRSGCCGMKSLWESNHSHPVHRLFSIFTELSWCRFRLPLQCLFWLLQASITTLTIWFSRQINF